MALHARLSGSVLLVVAALALNARSQEPIQWIEEPIDNGFDWPSTIGGGSDFHGTIAGRFTGNAVVSAAVLSGTEVVVLWAAHVAKGFIEVTGPSTPVTALATLPSSVASSHDSILALGANGLVELAYDTLTAELRELGPVGDSAWAGARAVIVEDVDDDGQPDVLGISSDGLSLLMLMGSVAGLQATTSIALPYTAQTICVLDYDDDPLDVIAAEIVVLTQGGLLFYTQQGLGWTLQQQLLTSISGGDIAVVGNTDGLDRLAWVTRSATGCWRLYHFRSGEAPAPVPLLIPHDTGQTPADFALVGIASGDRDGDGDDDLVIATTTLQRLFTLQNQAGTFDVATEGTGYEYVDLSDTPLASGAGNDCMPSFADHGSGLATIVAPVESAAHVVAVTGLSPEQEDAKFVSGGAGFFVEASKSHEPSNTTKIWVALAGVPSAWLAMDGLEWILWKQPSPSSYLEAQAIEHRYRPIGASCDRLYFTHLFNDVDLYSSQHYWLQVRFVNLDSQQHVVATRGDMILGMTAEDDWTYLQNRSGAGDESGMEACPSPPTYQFNCAGGGEVGAVVPQNDLPPFPPSAQPNAMEMDKSNPVELDTWCAR